MDLVLSVEDGGWMGMEGRGAGLTTSDQTVEFCYLPFVDRTSLHFYTIFGPS